jgi:hypothetical protein
MRVTKLLACLLILSVAVVSVSAQSVLVDEKFTSMRRWDGAYGDWRLQGGRLVQADTENRLAKINLPVRQTGTMQYEFNARYVAGGEDGHAGFGIHLFVDDAHPGKSWGNGWSYLMWINYDMETSESRHRGFRGQVYKSTSDTQMKLVESLNIRIPDNYLREEYIYATVPVKMVVDSNSGMVKVYDPLDMNYFYRFYLDRPIPRGSFISLRSNSFAVSFDDVKVTRLD